ncbi:MAG TPA: dihydrolipoamide acetyltransferase family protein [Solirubrobacter sp.]|nr:dihydrolipoamide acetyltransferase family protein [Solirubrobacter sp.]
MGDVAMPRLSDSMEEGTILKWLKSDGDEVSEGEELVEIETDKANMTYEADEAGTLKIVAKEGDTLPVGETIARIGEGGGDEEEEEEEEPSDEAAEEEGEEPGDEAGEEEEEAEEPEDEGDEEEEEEPEEEEEEEPEPEEEQEAEAEDEGGEEDGRVKASPIARRMARDMGLELEGLEGSGPGGRIVKADVEAAAKADKQEKPAKGKREEGRGEVTQQEPTRLQRTIARRMAESKATAPDFVLGLEVDMEEAVGLRGQLKAAAGDAPAPSFNDFVIKAAALALRDFPRANAAYRDGQFELYARVNVGIAVAGQDALVVPTVFDADQKSLGTIAAETRRLAERVREGEITPPELSSGTFTVSNLGMYGIRRFVAVINPPQAAILAVGELTPRPVVRDGEVVVRSIMELTLSCDHRILYGADAAEFLARIREYLEAPLRLAL